MKIRLHPSIVEQHCKFWDRSEASRPLIDFFVGSLFPLEDFRGGLNDGPLEPETIVPGAFEDFYRNMNFFIPQRGVLLETVFPFVPISWMEAIMGCPIRVSLETYSIGSVPFLKDLSDLDAIEEAALDPKNPWLLKLLEFQSFLVEMFGEEKPVGLPIMRGPADLAGAMLGGDRMVFEFYDHPQEMNRLLAICAKVWLETAHAQIELIPPFDGGYFNYRIMYCPGTSPVLQEDNASFLSPKLYEEFVLPFDRVILSEFGSPFFHTHSSSAHIILDRLLACHEVIALDSCWDLPPFGPPVEKLLPSYHQIQDAEKSLYILAVGPPKEEDLLQLGELSPKGLCIFFQAKDIDSGHRFAEKLESMWE